MSGPLRCQTGPFRKVCLAIWSHPKCYNKVVAAVETCDFLNSNRLLGPVVQLLFLFAALNYDTVTRFIENPFSDAALRDTSLYQQFIPEKQLNQRSQHVINARKQLEDIQNDESELSQLYRHQDGMTAIEQSCSPPALAPEPCRRSFSSAHRSSDTKTSVIKSISFSQHKVSSRTGLMSSHAVLRSNNTVRSYGRSRIPKTAWLDVRTEQLIRRLYT